jgi:long-chain acyl-CoA synthetase
VPRLYDGLRDGVLASVARAAPRQRKLFEWALGVGRRRGTRLAEHRRPDLLASLLWPLADRLVLKKVRAKIGCDRLRYFVSGSAPLSLETADFLLSVGIGFLEGWGLTETSPVITVNRPGNFRRGSVGLPIPGVELKVAEDGELICRGPNIMQGYLGKPEATAEAIDSEGWFHTGDIGRIDEDGFAYITDRKKDLIVLATGKKVAPQPIEARLKSSPFIREAVVLGDRMSACVALIIPAFDALTERGRKEGWKFSSESELCALSGARAVIKAEIDRLSTGLAEFEKIRSFALLAAEFSIESGELTPTLKVKRKVVMERYADAIRSLAG